MRAERVRARRVAPVPCADEARRPCEGAAGLCALWACEGAYAQFSTADVLRVDGKPPHLGLCRRGFNLIGEIQPVLIGWNLPDGVESSRSGGPLA